MKNQAKKIRLLVILASLVLGATSLFAYGGGGRGGSWGAGQSMVTTMINQMPYEELSQAEIDSLLKMREEEKLARDVYIYLGNLWQSSVFERIVNSEQRHMDAVAALLAKYNLSDPVANLGNGQFATKEMTDLYNALIAQGSQGLESALKVGATIEDLDIKDLEELMQVVDNEDIKTVYQNLTKGSRNHMRAFISSLNQMGSSYTAQYLSQEEIDEIVNSQWERGPVDKDGNPMNSSMRQMRRGNSAMGGCGGNCGRGPGFIDLNGDGVCDNLQTR